MMRSSSHFFFFFFFFFFSTVLTTTTTIGRRAAGDDAPYRDPRLPIEARISDLLSRMTLAEKIGQMTQIDRSVASSDVIRDLSIGSVLNGGESAPSPDWTPSMWADMVDGYQQSALSSRLGIPMIYGTDAIHGHNNVFGSTVFPHNIGLGATRDADLVLRIGKATALEIRGTGIPYTFAPCLADLQTNMPLLYFWYAEMELAACTSGNNSEPAVLRARHILSCLGSGVKYSSFKGQPSSTQLLRAHQGFKEQIKNLRSAWACGDIRDQSIALTCSAALFEELTTGWGAGLTVFEEAFTMALPERRSQSSHLESLFNHYTKMLRRHLNHMKLSKAWRCILQGLQIYPYSTEVFAAFIQVGCLYTVPNKLRQIVDEYCSKKPSVIVWMFALSFELAKSGSEHRIHSLFERALVNDRLQKSVTLWRCYLAYEVHIARNLSAAKRIFFRAIHSCPWSKKLWLDGFQKLNTILTAKELSDLQEVMSDKELHLRTDIYEILLEDEVNA